MPENNNPDLETEERQADIALKKAEAAKLSAEARQIENQPNQWWKNPLILGLFASAIGLIGNLGVAITNGNFERDLAQQKATAEYEQAIQSAQDNLDLEREKADAARILEVIRTNDSEQACENLKLLTVGKLISNQNIVEGINSYLEEQRQEGSEIRRCAFLNIPESVGLEVLRQEPVPSPCGNIMTGEIEQVGGNIVHNEYKLSISQSGTVLDLTTRPDFASLDTSFNLRDTNGNQILFADNGGSGESDSITSSPLQAGVYTLSVGSVSDTVGSYSLLIGCIMPNLITIYPGDPGIVSP